MNKIVFETSTIADVLTKAARISPKDNTVAFSKAPGLYIHVTDDDSAIIVRSTNTDVFYTQWSAGVDKSPGVWEWHVSEKIAAFCNTLPIGSGKFVTFSEENGILTIKYGKSVKMTRLIKGSEYPSWDAFDTDDSVIIDNLAEKMEMVQWAAALSADDAIPAASGVYMDGEKIVTSNGYRAATVEFDFPPAKAHPLTLPFKSVAPLLKNSVDIKATIIKNGLAIEPDEYSQIMITGFADNPAAKIKQLPEGDKFDYSIEFNTEQFSGIIQNMITSVNSADNPIIKLLIINDSILLTLNGKGEDTVQNILDVGTKNEEPVIIGFNPDDLLRAVSNTPSHSAHLYYSTSNNRMIFIQSGKYKAWLAQKVDINV